MKYKYSPNTNTVTNTSNVDKSHTTYISDLEELHQHKPTHTFEMDL